MGTDKKADPAKIRPDPEDIEAIKREYGFTDTVSDKLAAELYRRAQARKLIRLYCPEALR